MRLSRDQDDDRYTDWADQERVSRKGIYGLNKMFRRKARSYRECEIGGEQHERTDTECKAESGIYRTQL